MCYYSIYSLLAESNFDLYSQKWVKSVIEAIN